MKPLLTNRRGPIRSTAEKPMGTSRVNISAREEIVNPKKHDFTNSNPAPAHLLVIECVERISTWQHRRSEKNTPPTRASSRRGKRKEMREPDKEVTIYSSRCGIHAKVIPINRSRRMCFGRWAVGRGGQRKPTLHESQRLETGAEGKVRKRRFFSC